MLAKGRRMVKPPNRAWRPYDAVQIELTSLFIEVVRGEERRFFCPDSTFAAFTGL
jgi:hypothetical protein